MILGEQLNVVHPGYVKSKNDGETHWIGFEQLCGLYGLNPHDRRTMHAQDEGFWLGRRSEVVSARHFYPRNDGKYVRVSPPTALPLLETEDPSKMAVAGWHEAGF